MHTQNEHSKTIFFFSHNDQILLWDQLAQNLSTVFNYKTILLVLGKSDYNIGSKCKGYHDVIDVLSDMSSKQIISSLDPDYKTSVAFLADLELRTGNTFVQEDISMDRYFRGNANPEVDLKDYIESWEHEQVTYFMSALGQKIEMLFKQYHPILIYQETNSAPYRMTWQIAKLYNCISGYLMLVRGWEKRVYFEDGLCLEWNMFRKVYDELNIDELDADFLQRVRSRHQQITTSKELPKTYFQFSKKPDSLIKRLNLSRLLKNLMNKKHFTSDEWTHNPRSVSAGLFSYRQKFNRYLRRKSSYEYYQQNCKDDFDLSQAYAIYFLHVQPEITVEESAFEYMDQVATIRNIVAALPAGMPLIVKEHRPSAGKRPIEFYAELVHIPNVIILGDGFHSHDLIKNAKVVITLTGTVAIEAIYYFTPTIVLGNIYFNSCNGVYHPQSIPQLRQLLNNVYNLKGATENDALQFLAASYLASFPGRTFGLGINEANDDDLLKSSCEYLHSICKN
jgi:Capsule polysaccharide biosynthesis protein